MCHLKKHLKYLFSVIQDDKHDDVGQSSFVISKHSELDLDFHTSL